MKERIMYIEYKGDGLIGSARIGLVKFSKTYKSLAYKGKLFHRLKVPGFKSNYFESETGEEYWISGCKKDGTDRLYSERLPIFIDDDIQKQYWEEIRNLPNNVGILRVN